MTLQSSAPLAQTMRPSSWQDLVGQNHLYPNGLLKNSIDQQKPMSFLLWGPPGVGKTTIAKLYAESFSRAFAKLSAVTSTIADVKKLIGEQEKNRLFQQQIIIFLDEIHRFNKAQQDAFLPLIEEGRVILIGATTENPSFSVNNALLSRMRVLQLEPLSEENLESLLIKYEVKFGSLALTNEARKALIEFSAGDARQLFNLIENVPNINDGLLELSELTHLITRKRPLYDKNSEQHYNLISALHKSIRASDVDASLYYLARMLNGGEDRFFVIRRLIRIASEDIGLADPSALNMALSAKEAYQMLGSPEGELAIAQTAVYLALAPKSNALYKAFQEACELSEKTGHLSPPKSCLNAPTKLMRELGFQKSYVYDHDLNDGCSGIDYLPKELRGQKFYRPVKRGFEREAIKRLEFFAEKRRSIKQD